MSIGFQKIQVPWDVSELSQTSAPGKFSLFWAEPGGGGHVSKMAKVFENHGGVPAGTLWMHRGRFGVGFHGHP